MGARAQLKAARHRDSRGRGGTCGAWDLLLVLGGVIGICALIAFAASRGEGHLRNLGIRSGLNTRSPDSFFKDVRIPSETVPVGLGRRVGTNTGDLDAQASKRCTCIGIALVGIVITRAQKPCSLKYMLAINEDRLASRCNSSTAGIFSAACHTTYTDVSPETTLAFA